MGTGFKRVVLVANGSFWHLGAFFQRALIHLGFEVRMVDEARLTRPFLPLRIRSFNRGLWRTVTSFKPHLVFVVKGSYLWPSICGKIKSLGSTLLVNYSTDNPFNPHGSTSPVVQAIGHYDLYVTPTRALIPEIQRAGAQRVIWVPFGYEPTLHFPEPPSGSQELAQWSSDVVFPGLCDSDRVPFMMALSRVQGISLRLHGNYWQRVPELRPYFKGLALGRDYRLAIGGAKIALTIIRRANRDGHTMRTFEIPACGGFLLAERTPEHLEFFEEGKEMACFGSPEELVDKVRYFLIHDEERRRIAEAGYQKLIRHRHTYRDRLIQILEILKP